MQKTLVLWDWDNTLADTAGAVRKGIDDTADFYNVPRLTDAELKSLMTTHRGEVWHKYFKGSVLDAIEYYVSRYVLYSHETVLFPQAHEVLDFVQSRGAVQSILSNKNHDALVEEVRAKGVDGYFNEILGTNSDLGKPEVAFAKPVLDKVKPEKIIFIGDGVSDILMGKNIGATTILVHRQKSEDLPYDFHAETLGDVLKILQKLL